MQTKPTNHQQLQTEWDNAVERAQQESKRAPDFGEMLDESSGLHVKSGVQAGGLWGTTSCTCENTCDCTPP